MKLKLKNARPQAKRGRHTGDEDNLLAYLMNRNQSVYSPNGGYQVDFAPAEQRDYQAIGLPAAQIIGQSPNPQARYVNQLANQISQQRGVGNNNDYFRTVGILNNIMKDKKYVGKDGALNQQGWAKLAQDQMFGPGSDWYKRHSQSAKDVASALVQIGTLPYFAGMGGLELLGSVGGGALGSNIGINYETHDLNDAILRRKYGGRVKRPFGGGIPEGVPFVEGPVAYNPQYNGLWTPTTPIRNASPIDIIGGRPVVRGPIASNIISTLGTPVDELELNSWRTNAIGNPNTYALSTEQRPIKRAVNLNSRNNTSFNTSRTEQSWLNRKTPNKPLKISITRYNAGKALGAVSKAIPYYYGIELATTSGEPHYDAEGYLIDNITGERLESEPRHTPKVWKRLAKLQTQLNNIVSKYNQIQNSNNNNSVNRTDTNNNAISNRANTNVKPEQANTTAQQTAKQPVNNSTIQTNTKQSDIRTKTVISDKTSIPKNEDYTVVKGDSPWKIANKAGITVNTLYELNPGMEKRGVYVGDNVNLTRNITNDQQIEKVTKRGDSPWAIAHRYGMTLDEFYKLNPNAKSRGIYIGDEFVVNKNRNQKKYGGAVRRRLESGGQLSY